MMEALQTLVQLFLVTFCFCSTVPITNCITGRNTQYINNQQAGECSYGSLMGPMGPGYLYIAAASDNTDPNFGGYANASLCGQCFEVTGPEGAVRLMITDHCPDCPILQPHFDCSPEAMTILRGSANTNWGLLSNSWRKVACDVVGNVKVQFKTGSNPYFVGLLFANHRVGIENYIQVKENGMPDFYYVQRQPYNFFEFSPLMSPPTPMTIIVTSIFGDNINFTLNSITPLAIIDTGGQFPVPTEVNNCTSCPTPPVNNGQTYIYNDSFFPEQTGVWLPATQQQWADWSGRTWIQNSTNPYSGQYSAMTVMNPWDTLNFGCNIPSPKSSIISIEFAVRLENGTSSTTTAWLNNYPHITLPPLNTSWTYVVIPVANNSDITGTVSNFLVQNGGTQLTYFFDQIQFVLPPPPACGNTSVVYYPPPSSSTSLCANQIMIFVVVLLSVVFNYVV